MTERISAKVTGSHTPGSMRELLHAAIPLMVCSGSQAMMNAADRAVLAGWSAEALAAVSPASMLYWTCVCIPLGVVLYANTLIAQYEGANRPDGMMAAMWQAIWLSLFAGCLLPLLMPLTETLLLASGQLPRVAELQSEYFNTLCGGSSLILLSTACSSYFSGRRRTLIVMLVGILAVILNLLLDWVLVFGVGRLEAQGIAGAAIATLLARVFEIVVYSALIFREASRQQVALFGQWKPQWRYLRTYLRFGVPSGLHFFVDYSGFAAFLLMIGSIGESELGATNLAFSVNGLVFVPLLGFGTAIQTVVGHHVGACRMDAARGTTRCAVIMGLLWTGLAGLLLVCFPGAALRPFFLFADVTEEMLQLSADAGLLLRFVAVYSVFDALAVVFASSLRGAGDTLFPMLLTMASSWLVMVLPAWLMLVWMSPSLQQMWLSPTAGITVAGLLMWLRYRSGEWMKIRLTEQQ